MLIVWRNLKISRGNSCFGRSVKDIHYIFPVIEGVDWGKIVNVNVIVNVIVNVVVNVIVNGSMSSRREIILRLARGI
jgi:hypothetical protein